MLENTIFHDEGINQKLEEKEMANVFNIHMDRSEGIIENKLNLQTCKEIPGKVSYSRMYFLS